MITVPFHDNNIAFKAEVSTEPPVKKQKTAAVNVRATTSVVAMTPSKLRIKIHSPFKATATVPSPSPSQDPTRKVTAKQLDFDNDTATTSATTSATTNANAALLQELEPTPIEKMWRLEDHYKLQQLLGEGAFGKVYEAIRISDGQLLALKVIPKYTSTDQALEREIQALCSLSEPGHEHVCQLYNHHRDENNVYLAMEYIVGGGELFEHLVKTGPFSEQDASRFLREFAQGLAYIHGKGYTHGDLKPENLLMSNDAQRPCVKIVDFGFCVPSKQEPPTKLVFGTVAYLAPEILQSLGVPQQPTPSVDMYAVGVIMYTLLTGTHPFDRTNCASDDSIRSAMVTSLHQAKANSTPDYLSKHVFDDRVATLSPSSIELMRNLLQPRASKRMTSHQFQNHPWIQGQTATKHAMLHSDTKLRRFWQRRFRAAIMKNFQVGVLSDDERLKAIYYDSMDINGSGRVSFQEFQIAMKDIFGIHQMKDLFASVDLQQNGYLDYDEFVSIMKTQFDNTNTAHLITRAENLGVMAETVAANEGKMPPKVHKVSENSNSVVATASTAPKMSRRRSTMGVRTEILRQFGRRTSTTSHNDLELIFGHLDQNQDGSVDISELMDFLQDQNNVDADAISEWADEVDRDMDGTISFDEFYEAMTKIR
ncbi:MAG: hypothetical protein SGBAC_011916 [Bacillariaceae sp.]